MLMVLWLKRGSVTLDLAGVVGSNEVLVLPSVEWAPPCLIVVAISLDTTQVSAAWTHLHS